MNHSPVIVSFPKENTVCMNTYTAVAFRQTKEPFFIIPGIEEPVSNLEVSFDIMIEHFKSKIEKSGFIESSDTDSFRLIALTSLGLIPFYYKIYEGNLVVFFFDEKMRFSITRYFFIGDKLQHSYEEHGLTKELMLPCLLEMI